MLNKKIILSILLVSFMFMSSVSAADNLTEDIVGVEVHNDVNVVDSINNQCQTSIANSKSFSELNSLINDNSNVNIYLTDENVESEKGIITQEINMCNDMINADFQI